MFRRISTRSTAHLSQEDILAHLDGELGSRQAEGVAAHLKSCWTCRAEAQRIEKAIGDFANSHRHTAAAHPPEGNWSSFRARLDVAARQQLEVRPWWQRPAWFRVGAPAAASAAGVLVILWLYFGPAPAVSASEILHRAETAAETRIRNVSSPVIYQKIRIQRKGRSYSASATIESWTDLDASRKIQAGETQIWNELRPVLERNGMGRQAPLSSAAYAAWWTRAGGGQGQVIERTLDDGSQALEILASNPKASDPGDILEASLVLRTRDWHPVEQILKVGSGSDRVEYDLKEVAYQLASRESVRPVAPPELAAGPDAAGEFPTKPAPVAASPAADTANGVDGDESELSIHSVLHRLRACMGEQIEVRRHGGTRLQVRGVVEGSERKKVLIAALQAVPNVTLDLVTAEEYGRRETNRPGAAPSGQLSVQRGPSTAEERIRGVSEARFIVVANRMVELSASWTSHAWAIAALARAFPQARVASMGPAERAILAGMIADHADALERDAESARVQHREVYPGATPDNSGPGLSGSWNELAETVLRAGQRAQALTHEIFAASAPPNPDAPASLHEALAHLRATCRVLEEAARAMR